MKEAPEGNQHPAQAWASAPPSQESQYILRCLQRAEAAFILSCSTLLEGLGFQEATVHPDGVALQFATPKQPNAAAGGAGGEGSELRVATQQPSSRAQVRVCGNQVRQLAG